jgi:hypothetical protein
MVYQVEMISMAVHRNLLRLRGFCMTPTERLLVYPYMPNGSVASRLRGIIPVLLSIIFSWTIVLDFTLGSCCHPQCSVSYHQDFVSISFLFLCFGRLLCPSITSSCAIFNHPGSTIGASQVNRRRWRLTDGVSFNE